MKRTEGRVVAWEKSKMNAIATRATKIESIKIHERQLNGSALHFLILIFIECAKINEIMLRQQKNLQRACRACLLKKREWSSWIGCQVLHFFFFLSFSTALCLSSFWKYENTITVESSTSQCRIKFESIFGAFSPSLWFLDWKKKAKKNWREKELKRKTENDDNNENETVRDDVIYIQTIWVSLLCPKKMFWVYF